MSFDLRSELWIPVILKEGTAIELSLRDCFLQGDEVRRINGELPTQSFAILRLLLAITHDAIGFYKPADVTKAIRHGIDVQAVLAYLDEHADRFDLFHPERPFFQVATLRTAKDDVSGLEKLISDVPNGEPFLTTRAGRGLERISAAEAARWLVHAQSFDPSGIRSGAVGDPAVKGGKGFPIGPAWAGQIGGIVLHGTSLSETIAYNLAPTPRNDLDRPVWAKPEPQTEQRQHEPKPNGPVELLAWQSRRIRLVGDRTGVTGLVLCQGDRMTPQNRFDLEHMTAWRYSLNQSKKHGADVYMPLKHDPNRSVWRGVPELLGRSPKTEGGKEKTLPSTTVATIGAQLYDLEDLDLTVGIEVIGMDYGGNEATVAELVHDTLDFRLSLLGEQAADVRTMVHDAVGLADNCVWILGTMAKNIAQAAGDFDGLDGASEKAKLEAWSALDAPARRWLSELQSGTDTIAAMSSWQKVLRRVLEREAAKLASSCSPAAVIGRRTKHGFMTAAKAESFFRKKLRDELPLAYPKKQQSEEHADE
ncbi:MAG: type I-E CRISPR-associated protein Cse1/CasA [Propionibacteriaceae bacterium]|nr:type I-E CRISPR-associated protein Cse1/CasA [Propionibacteriaceae bacterium]